MINGKKRIASNEHTNHLTFRDNCSKKAKQLDDKAKEVAELKTEVAKKEKEKEELDKRTSLEIKMKEKRIAEHESDISSKQETIEQLTNKKNGLLSEVDQLNKNLFQRGDQT